MVDLTPAGVSGARAWAINGNQVVGTDWDTTKFTYAIRWTGAGNQIVNLTPGGFYLTHVRGVYGTQQAGMGHNPTDGKTHALLWNSSPTNYVDLNPSWFDSSSAYSMWGNREAGFGRGLVTGGQTHALLWSGTPASAVDLNPTGFISSSAYGIFENHEVGQGLSYIDNRTHALFWSGTAASVVNLTPRVFTFATAQGIFGNQVVGSGGNPHGHHALLWTDATAGFVDMNPVGFISSIAMATNGVQQVGYGIRIVGGGNNGHALVWNGTADSVIDLQQFLPKPFVNSVAWAINANGDIVGWADNGGTEIHAIEWIPVGPTPKTIKASAQNAETDGRNLCLYNEGEIASQCLNYATHNHQHLFPDNLGELILKGLLLPENLVDPSSGTVPLVIPAEHATDITWINTHLTGHCDYVYAGAGLDFQKLAAAGQLATTVIVYESLSVHKGQTALFAYADNHLAWLSPNEFYKATAWPTSP